MAQSLKPEIVTPESTVYSEEVSMVTLPGKEGEMGILPQHIPLMTQVSAGEIAVEKTTTWNFWPLVMAGPSHPRQGFGDDRHGDQRREH